MEGNNMKSSFGQGFTMVIISALFYGSLPIFVKFAYASGLTVGQTLLLRYYSASVILAAALFALGQLKRPHLGTKEIGQSLAYIMASISYLASLKFLPASIAAIVFFSNPIVVAFLSRIIDRRSYISSFYVSLILVIIGLILVIMPWPPSFASSPSLKGLALALAGSIFWGLYSYMGERTTESQSPLLLSLVIMLISSAVLSLFFWKDISLLTKITLTQLGIGLELGFFNTVCGVVLFLSGLTRIGAARASLLATLEPIIGVLLAGLVLDEQISAVRIIGTTIFMLGIITARKQEGNIA